LVDFPDYDWNEGGEEHFELYPDDEDFYEAYEAQIADGTAEPIDIELTRRIRAMQAVSQYDTSRSTTPYFSLGGVWSRQRPNLRTRVTSV
jgi:hypothetical protein